MKLFYKRLYGRYIRQVDKKIDNHSFAVVGTYHGSGCTVLCVNFAAFLAQEFSQKIAVIETNNSGDFAKMSQCEEFVKYARNVEGGFCIDNIYYYYNVSREFSAYLRSEKFGFFVYDMGTEFLRNEEIFLSCNQKIVVGSHLGWRKQEYDKVLSCAGIMGEYRKWEYIDMLKGKGEACFIDDGRIKLKKMPFIDDVLVVSDKAERVYRSFL